MKTTFEYVPSIKSYTRTYIKIIYADRIENLPHEEEKINAI